MFLENDEKYLVPSDFEVELIDQLPKKLENNEILLLNSWAFTRIERIWHLVGYKTVEKDKRVIKGSGRLFKQITKNFQIALDERGFSRIL